MRIDLRPTVPADIERIVEIERSPEARSFITARDRVWHEQALEHPGLEHLAVIDDQDVIGIVLIGGLANEHHSVELRKIAVAVPGRGVGRRALELALDRCFDRHGAHRVWLDVKPSNHRARRVYEALGFVAEGTARESYLYEGEYESLLVMSILDREWRARRTGEAE